MKFISSNLYAKKALQYPKTIRIFHATSGAMFTSLKKNFQFFQNFYSFCFPAKKYNTNDEGIVKKSDFKDEKEIKTSKPILGITDGTIFKLRERLTNIFQ